MSDGFNMTHHAGFNLGFAMCTGAAAGNVTCPGIKPGDKLLGVWVATITGSGVTDVTSMLADFAITAANTINNAGKTTTASKLVLVVWRISHPNE